MRNLKLSDALNVRFDSDVGENTSVRDYLKALLSRVWIEGEGFSGKRPFGNSGWEYDLYAPLIKHGFIAGKLDEDGFIDSVNDKKAHAYVLELIEYVFMCSEP